ncbi:hypothetical protein GGX14DRAFT_393481 [Mycena pura]|uniref:Uncharacterized protein n=1 Tax=Mycena pura TaxID=153505 RepID=A0AAD6YGM1_9AGAR|nr:hypothetical protein GGX14DRAFT_393481 [Mycena pura]
MCELNYRAHEGIPQHTHAAHSSPAHIMAHQICRAALATSGHTRAQLIDITPSELYPLVQSRERNQTEDAHCGVRSYIPGSAQARQQQANTASESATPIAVQANKKNLLYQHKSRYLLSAFKPGPSDSTAAVSKPKGNAANAAAAGEVRGTTVGSTSEWDRDRPLGEDDFVFVIERQHILLARDSAGCMFQRTHSGSTALSISRFARLPAGSVLFRVPDKVTLKAVCKELQTIVYFTIPDFLTTFARFEYKIWPKLGV